MALLLALYLLWRIRQVVLLIFMAVILAIPLNRLVKRWQQIGIDRKLAIPLAMLSLFCITLFLGLVIVPPFVEQLRRLVGLTILEFSEVQVRLLSWLSQWLSRWSEQWPEQWSEQWPTEFPLAPSFQQMQPWATWLFNQVYPLFSDAISVLLQFLLVLVLTAMLLTNPMAYRQSAIRLFPSFYRPHIDTVLSQCETRLVLWMQNLTRQMAIVGGAAALGLLLLQIPLALTNAALASLLEVIPYLGVLLSLIPPLVVGGLETPWKAIAVISLYLLLQWLKRLPRRDIRPTILPALMLLAQLSFTFFCGFLGLLLAVPIVIIAEVWMREVVVRDLVKGKG